MCLAEEMNQGRRRAGEDSVEIEVSAGARIEQVFPAPADQLHTPQAGEWAVTRTDDAHVRLTAATVEKPSARIFRVA